MWCGIDVGAKGALAIIDEEGAKVYDFPGDISSLGNLFINEMIGKKIKGCVIEKVSAMPKQGVVSMFKFGCNFGSYLGILSVLQIPHILVTPQSWQKKMLDAGTGNTKERSLNMARRLFPDIDLSKKKHDGRADALHLARYAIEYFN